MNKNDDKEIAEVSQSGNKELPGIQPIERDLELDDLLGPLQKLVPPAQMVEKWQQMVMSENKIPLHRGVVSAVTSKRTLRRLTEWAIAASIGFAVGSYYMNRSEDRRTAYQTPGQNIMEMDATEMELVAKSL